MKIPECQDCGACCISSVPDYVELMPRDEVPDIMVRMITGFPFMRMVGRPVGRCVALCVDGARYSCSIYRQRPMVCREFERGGPRCMESLRDAQRVAKARVAAPFPIIKQQGMK